MGFFICRICLSLFKLIFFILIFFFSLPCSVAEKEPINKMSLHNLATVFGPTLLRPSESENAKAQHITSVSDIWSHDVMAQVCVLDLGGVLRTECLGKRDAA